MPQPIISVLIPAYNVENYIQEAIASIQAQTLPNFEMIVLNDGSCDGTLSVAERMARVDPRIRIISLPSRSGIVTALNTGLLSCTAPFIARMDADDVAVPDRLERQLVFLQSRSNVALVGSAMTTINENGEEVGFAPVPITEKAITRSLVFGPPCSHIWLARRKLYEQLKGYRELAPAEDYDFLLRAVASGFQIANLPEPLMRIRVRAGNSAGTEGLTLRKTHRYVLRLYRERLERGSDSFSRSNYESAVRGSNLATAVHKYAIRLVQKAFSKPGRVRRVCLCAVASLLSPWQARYFLDRLLWRMTLLLS
jgi:glycosyltransferase involved in cell wall biosynthesis